MSLMGFLFQSWGKSQGFSFVMSHWAVHATTALYSFFAGVLCIHQKIKAKLFFLKSYAFYK
jgi:hypothetical protein